MGIPARPRGLTVALVPALVALAAGLAVAASSGNGDYTPRQAASGGTVYVQHCSQCHGANLQGGAGPALSGAAYEKTLRGETASQLFDFIHTQMPANAPGSLSTQQYLDVTAFLLSRNGYPPSKSNTLTAQSLSGVNLAAQANTAGAGIQEEIVRNAAPQTVRLGPLPGGANVNITDAMLAGAMSDPNDWRANGRDYDNSRYSPLDQITTANIKELQPAGFIQTGYTASFETTPIEVGGVLFITTPVVNNKMLVAAYDATNGRPIWQTTYNLGSFKICCGPVNRGVAVAYGKVYFVTLDDNLVALDARTGKYLWQTRVANPNLGYSETMTPQVYRGKVIVGSAGGEWPIRGFIAAYNAGNGKQMWRYWTTDPSTYANGSWKSGGAMVWTTPAIDTRLGEIVFSTGNPNPDLYGSSRKGDNRWSDSIVAIDANTGKLKWGYQEVKHDVWDYDAVSPPVLFDVTVNGHTVPAAGEAGKVGWFFIVDRRNGHLIKRSQNYVAMTKNMFSQPTAKGVMMLPGANGGAEWSPPAYSPKTHYAYVLGMDQLMNFQTHRPDSGPGEIKLGSAFTNVAKGAIQDGRFVAIDTQSGRVAWTAMTKQPLIGGALVTGGNLAFMGEGNGDLDAFDAQSGHKVWSYNLGAGVNAPPISYAVNGVQYIAVAAGGNFQLSYPLGDAIVIFKLPPGAPAPASSP